MFKSFVKHGSVYLGTIVAARSLDFLLLPIYTRLLSQAEFGLLDMVLAPIDFLTAVAGLHLAEATGKFRQATTSEEERALYSSTGLWGELVGHLLLAVAAAVLARPLSAALLGDARHLFILRLGLTMAVCRCLSGVVQKQFRWELRSLGFAISRLAYAVVANAVALGLVIGLGWQADGMVAGYAVAGLLVGGIGFWHLRRSFGCRPRLAAWLAMARYGAPLVPREAARFLTPYINRRILLHYHSLATVGLYGMGTRLAFTFDIVMGAIHLTLLPLVFGAHQQDDTPGHVARIFRYTVALGVFAFVGYSLFAREVLGLFTTGAYVAAHPTVCLLFPGRFLGGLQLFAIGIWIRGRTRLIGLVALFGVLLEVHLNLQLVERFGIIGTAAATAVAGAVCFCLSMGFSQRLYPVPHRWGPMLATAAAAIGLVAMGLHLVAPLPVAIAVKLLLVAAAGAAILACRLVSVGELRHGLTWAWSARPGARRRG